MIRVSHERERGCGFRKVGGFYVVGGAVMTPCGRLPLAVESCSVCGGGIKQRRASFDWIEPRRLWGAFGCDSSARTGIAKARGEMALLDCSRCPCGPDMPERAALRWVGAKHYPTPAHFVTEAARQGASLRVTAPPRGLVPGETVVFLAHPKGFRARCSLCGGGFLDEPARHTEKTDCPRCDGEGVEFSPGVFGTFTPTALEKVVSAHWKGLVDSALEKDRKALSFLEAQALAEYETMREREIEPVRS